MSKKNSKTRDARPGTAAPIAPTSAGAYGAAARALPILGLAWAGLVVLSIVLAGCPRFSGFYFAYVAIALGLAAGVLAFLDAIWRKGKTSLLPAFKKFLGYGLVMHYAASALPRVDWANAGLIGQGRVAFLFVLACACLALGSVLFVLLGRPRSFAALGLISAEELGDKALRKKRMAESRKKGFLHGALEWIDALGFAAILVILVNTFVFQLYEIPSESMVPAFLKKDRPFTGKFLAGPRIPLTDMRLPFLKLPARGDIITIANPRYPENQSVNLKKYLSQLVQMITFTAVNIDRYLPDGSEKADPLVKRIVGEPGEKLMMVDDVLYAKKKGQASWSPIEADKTWACVDLWKLSADLRVDERNIIDEEGRAVLSRIDARKNGADPATLAAELKAAGERATKAAVAFGEGSRAYERKQAARADLGQAFAAIAAEAERLARVAQEKAGDPRSSGSSNLISEEGQRLDDLALALELCRSAPLREAFSAYCGSFSASAVSGSAATGAASGDSARGAALDAYTRGSRSLNLIVKLNLAQRVERDLALFAAGSGLDLVAKDEERNRLGTDARQLYVYVAAFYDRRNFPEFPAGDEYLGPQQYFAMGDNRYNSLDFRFDTVRRDRALDSADPASVVYSSDLRPFALDLQYIEGFALFRVWPPSRLGAIH